MSGFNAKKYALKIFTRIDYFAARCAMTGRLSYSLVLWRLMNNMKLATTLNASARQLLAMGRNEEAFKLALAGAAMGGRQGSSSSHLYGLFSFWLSKAGFVFEAEERLRALIGIQNNSLKYKSLLVDLWIKRSVLDDRIAPELVEFIEAIKENTSGNEEDREFKDLHPRALRLLYMIEGPSPRVLNLYECAAKAGNAAVEKAYLSLCSITEPQRFINYFNTEGKERSKYQTTLAMDLFLAHSEDDLKARIGNEQALELALAYEKSNNEIWSRIADPKLSIVVVGNSPCEIGLEKGAFIDSHDIVIRFNMADISEKYSVDYGSKTDIRVVNQTILAKFRKLYSGPLIVTGPDWELFTEYKSAAMELVRNGCSLATIPRNVRQALNRMLKASSSSGIQTCAAVCMARGGNRNVDFVGFSFVDQIGPAPTSANYFRQSRPAASHNWHGEALVLQSLLQTGDITASQASISAERYNNHWKDESAFRPVRFRLMGDHSDYHCGSAAVVRHLTTLLEHNGVMAKDGDFDIFVMNGEGSMHHGSKAFIRKMEEMRAMLDAGKTGYLVNTVWQDNPPDYDDVLKRLSGIQVREVMSQDDLWQRHGVESRVFPDLAYFSPLKKPKKITDFQGRIVMTDFYSKEFEAFVKLTRTESLKYPYIDMMSGDWSDLVHSLRTAKILITGRHHGVFAACRAEIPFVPFGGNTHKIEGIFVSAGVNIPICSNRKELAAHIEWASSHMDEYEKLFNWLKGFKKWYL